MLPPPTGPETGDGEKRDAAAGTEQEEPLGARVGTDPLRDGPEGSGSWRLRERLWSSYSMVVSIVASGLRTMVSSMAISNVAGVSTDAAGVVWEGIAAGVVGNVYGPGLVEGARVRIGPDGPGGWSGGGW